MNESKIDLTHRLQREGRWSEASKFKDDRIALLRSEDMPRREAQSAAWEEMEKKFPPIEDHDQSLEPEAVPTEWSEDAGVDFAGDAMWVYSKLACANVKPADAPSAGAWSLLRWAKRHQDRFYEQTMPKALAAKQKKKEEEKLDPEYEDDLSEVYQMLSDLNSQVETSLIADTPKEVQRNIGQRVVEWNRRFGLSIPEEALEGWKTEMIKLANEIIRAVTKNPEAFPCDRSSPFGLRLPS